MVQLPKRHLRLPRFRAGLPVDDAVRSEVDANPANGPDILDVSGTVAVRDDGAHWGESVVWREGSL